MYVGQGEIAPGVAVSQFGVQAQEVEQGDVKVEFCPAGPVAADQQRSTV